MKRFVFHSLIAALFWLPTLLFSQDRDNFFVLDQSLPAAEYAGKKFRLEGAVRVEAGAGGMATLWARVDRKGGETGFFDNMLDRPVTAAAWSAYSIEGVIDTDAATLHFGGLCLMNGTFFFDNFTLSVETAPGQWTSAPLSNPGFETTAPAGTLPPGWKKFPAATPKYETVCAPDQPFEGKYALAISGKNIDAGALSGIAGFAGFVRENYTKTEHYIPMRDGVKLFTVVYAPKDAGPDRTYPIMLNRTCYSVGPYGADRYKTIDLAPSETMGREKYIFVHQDVRGRYMSEGRWTNMTPHISEKKSPADVDESSDTYDAIDWLLKNVPYHNGRVGQWGISYPGFYTSAGAIDAHPALKASSPQAPVADIWFDDFHHNGAYTLGYFWNTPLFGTPKESPVASDWFSFFPKPTPDAYQFFKDLGPLKNGNRYYDDKIFLWKELTTHHTRDDFWKKRRIVDHLRNLKHAFLVVGGWYDAEDLYGALETYREIEKHNPGIPNTIVMGPFGHGDWASEQGHHKHHDLYFGDSISTFYQRDIEAKFFRHYLKENSGGVSGIPEAQMYDTGKKAWTAFAQWPPAAVKPVSLYFHSGEKLSFDRPAAKEDFSEYVSDPKKPVPYTQDIPGSFGITPRNYMSEDQRFAARRPDVLAFETDTLSEDVILAGGIDVELFVSTTGTDADWVVKLVDVYPGREPNTPYTPAHISLGDYQQMVRSEVMRSRFRNSFERPEPMKPGVVTPVRFKLQDVYHTFKKGHKIMIQVQSSWFPLIDLNPQKFVPNIFEAGEADFIKATQRVYHNTGYPSRVTVQRMYLPAGQR